MRQLIVVVPRGEGASVLELARKKEGLNLVSLEATDGRHPVDLTLVHLSNAAVDEFLGEVQKIPSSRITLVPRGIMTFLPPHSQIGNQTRDVSSRSPLEVLVSGLQSIGSWKGFLSYAVAASWTAWVGMYTNTIYLLVAAMLIAPFAGPAMALAMGTARGDMTLIRQSVIRYISSLVVAIGVAAVSSLIFGPDLPTRLMTDTALLSSLSVILPLVAGAVGALVLCQSERNSLVTATGPGMLIAASLAPPAALVGMALTLGRESMIINGVFLLALQLVGINLSGAVVFSIYGIKPKSLHLEHGSSIARYVTYGTTGLILAGLMFWQFHDSPEFQRSTRSKAIASEVVSAINQSGLAKSIETNVRFTRADVENQNSALIVAYVQKSRGAHVDDDVIKERLEQRILERVKGADFDVTPLLSLTVLEAVREAE